MSSKDANVKDATAKSFLEKYKTATEDERTNLVVEASNGLSNTQFKMFKRGTKSIEADEKNSKKEEEAAKEGGKDDEDEEDSEDVDSEDEIDATITPSTSVTKPSGKREKKSKTAIQDIVVDDNEIRSFWSELESMTGDDLLNDQIAEDLRYIGFDPNLIMKSIITRGKHSKKQKDEILSDIASMCTMAIIKGSITDLNLKKMSDNGKQTYKKYESAYGLQKGGSKGLDPSVITIARVGAAFPGSMMKILLKKPDLAKKFSGPFGSKVLPSYLRHQSAAACIPETMHEGSRTFLLGIITAYTSDQSKVISKTKDKPEEIFERQENFIQQTHSSSFPSEEVRKQIFKSWSLVADFDKMKSVSDNIVKHVKSFEPMSKEDFLAGLSSV